MSKKAIAQKKAVTKRRESRQFKKEREKTDPVGCKTRFVKSIRKQCPGMRITRSMLEALMRIMTQLCVDHFGSIRCMLGDRTMKPVDVYRHQAIMSGTNPGLISIIRRPAGILADQIVADLRVSQYAATLKTDPRAARAQLMVDESLHLTKLAGMKSDNETLRRTWAICGAAGIDPGPAVARVDAATLKARCSLQSEN